MLCNCVFFGSHLGVYKVDETALFSASIFLFTTTSNVLCLFFLEGLEFMFLNRQKKTQSIVTILACFIYLFTHLIIYFGSTKLLITNSIYFIHIHPPCVSFLCAQVHVHRCIAPLKY